MLDFIINIVSKLYTVLLLPHGTHARVDVDLILRTVFGFYYVPLVLFVLLVGANVALQFVYVTVLPTVQNLPLLHVKNTSSSSSFASSREKSSSSSFFSIDGATTALTADVLKASLFDVVVGNTGTIVGSKDQEEEILRKKQLLEMILAHVYFWVAEVFTALIPHATLFFCLMGFMHKIVTASGEAVIDTMSYYRGLDYPLLFATMKVSVLASWNRQLLSFLVGSTILYGAWMFASGFMIHLVLTRPTSVIVAVFSNVLWCATYLLLTFISAWNAARKKKSMVTSIPAPATSLHQEENENKNSNSTTANNNNDSNNAENTSRTSTRNKIRNVTSSATSKVQSGRSTNNTNTNNNNNNNNMKASSSSLSSADGSSLVPFWNELHWLQSRFGIYSTWPAAASAAAAASAVLSHPPSPLPPFHRSHQSDEVVNCFVAAATATHASHFWISEWWRNHVNFIRHISLSFLLVFVVFWMMTEGPISAFTFAVETLIALNVPNFCIYFTLKIVVAIIRAFYGFHWLIRHRGEGWVQVVGLISLPYLTVIVYTASFVSSTSMPLVALAWAGIQVVARSILLCREHDVSGDEIVWSTILTHHHHLHHQHHHQNNNNDNNNQDHDRFPVSAEQQQVVSLHSSAGVSPVTQDSLYLPSSSNLPQLELPSALMSSSSSPATSTRSSTPAASSTTTSSPTTSTAENSSSSSSALLRTKRRVAPGIAALLENAFECGAPTTTETISLEVEADLAQMKLFKRGLVMDLVREEKKKKTGAHQGDGNGEGEGEGEKDKEKPPKRRIPVIATAIQLLPRLFLFQSSPSFSGARFQLVRTVLRVITGSLLAVFILLVVCLVAQESMEVLRPLPMKLNCLDSSFSFSSFSSSSSSSSDIVCHDLEIDHLLVKLRLQLFDTNSNKKTKKANSDTKGKDKVDERDEVEVQEEAQNEGRKHRKSIGKAKKMHEFAVADPEGAGGPICDIEAVKDRKVHLWELTWLSVLPYLDNMQNATVYLNTVNKALDSDWQVLPFHEQLQQQQQQQKQKSGKTAPEIQEQSQHLHGLSRQARQPWRSFMRLRSPSRNVTVVTIRGTDMTSVLDALQDVDMYLESFVYHIVSHLVPGLRMLPGQIVRDLIRLSSDAWPQDGIACIDRGCERDAAVRAERRYYDIVLRFLNDDADEFATKYPHDRLLQIGHSLGGSIGAIVASRFPLAYRSYGFSSPGVELSMYKFGISSPEAVRRKATTVAVDNDVVPLIGGQIGTSVPLACFDSVKERCHSMESIVNSMWQICKEETLRERFPNVKDVILG